VEVFGKYLGVAKTGWNSGLVTKNELKGLIRKNFKNK